MNLERGLRRRADVALQRELALHARVLARLEHPRHRALGLARRARPCATLRDRANTRICSVILLPSNL